MVWFTIAISLKVQKCLALQKACAWIEIPVKMCLQIMKDSIKRKLQQFIALMKNVAIYFEGSREKKSSRYVFTAIKQMNEWIELQNSEKQYKP